MTALQRKKRFLHTLARGNDNMIECDGIVMTGLVRVSAIGGSASNANRQIARSTSNRNNERRVEYGIEIRQWRRRACSLEKILRDDDAAMLLLGHFQKPARDVDGVARGADLLLGRRAEPRQNDGAEMEPDPEIQTFPRRRRQIGQPSGHRLVKRLDGG